MSVYTIYGNKECICIHVLFFFFFCLFCVSMKLLQGYQIQPPREPFWPRFYKPAPALPALLSIFIPLHLVFSCACKVELSQTFVLTFGCVGLQLASPKPAFVRAEGGGCGCMYLSDGAAVLVLRLLCKLCFQPLQDIFMNQIFWESCFL